MPDLDEVLNPEALWDVFNDAAINNVYATCPYLLKNGEAGAYGPNTCHGGCREEPECVTGGPHAEQDEMEAVADYLRRALTEGDTP